ncbi:hypothetical protein LHP98_19165 [Rhodobacter sp. Har01]|nr:hypothetical protein [Rhodobacter sp. Har01]MCB6180230.1 hypothetical protein [Rhodobacter sp. Har01]
MLRTRARIDRHASAFSRETWLRMAERLSTKTERWDDRQVTRNQGQSIM